MIVRDPLPEEIRGIEGETQNYMGRLHDEKRRVIDARDRSYGASTAAIAVGLLLQALLPVPLQLIFSLIVAPIVTKRAIEEGVGYDYQVIDNTRKLASCELLLTILGAMLPSQQEENIFLSELIARGKNRESFLRRMILRYHELFKLYLIYAIAICTLEGYKIDLGFGEISGIVSYAINGAVLVFCLFFFVRLWLESRNFTGSRDDPRVSHSGYALQNGQWIPVVFKILTKNNGVFVPYPVLSEAEKTQLNLAQTVGYWNVDEVDITYQHI